MNSIAEAPADKRNSSDFRKLELPNFVQIRVHQPDRAEISSDTSEQIGGYRVRTLDIAYPSTAFQITNREASSGEACINGDLHRSYAFSVFPDGTVYRHPEAEHPLEKLGVGLDG